MGISVEAFVQKTRELLEKEREAELEETRLLQENVSAKELERRGVCLTRLRVASTHTGLYGRTVLVFEPYWPGKDLPSHTFTPGDISGLSLSRTDENNESIGSGIVSRVTASSISVAFDESYDSSSLDDNSQYKLVKLANDVTHRRLKKVLKELNSYRGGRASRLIDVLFGEAELGPPFNTARDGKDAFDPDSLLFFNTRLDYSQKEAVNFALSQREMAIIHGPPGTGKTTTVVEIILQAIKQGLKILVCAPSNVAVDNLVERLASYKAKVIRLGHPARLLENIQKLSLDAVLRHSDEALVTEGIRQDMDKAVSRLKKTRDRGEKQQLRSELRLMRKELKQQESVAMKEVLKRASVIAATLTSSTDDGPLKHLGQEHFDLVIIDECSQATEVSCWLGLLWGPKVILAGDHHQLPPTIISHEAAKEGLALTLMERQLELHGKDAMRMLTVQYRMNADIMKWASDQLYQGKLTAHSSVAQHLLKDLPSVKETEDTSSSLLLVDTAGCDLWELDVPDEVSKGNEGEVDLCVVHVEKLIEAGIKAEEIAVIAPYNLQVELLRLKLSQKYPKLEIKSVDGFQGREKEAVVISMVRSNAKGVVGFLAEDRRINVAITRARRHLALICDSETVGKHKFLQSLVDYMTQHGEVRSAEQYIREGEIDPTAKRPDVLQARIDASTSKQSTKPKASKQSKKKGQKEETKQPCPPEKTAKREEKVPDINIKSEEDELRDILTKFALDEKQKEHAFPPSLSSRQRYLVHDIAEVLELTHISQGEGAERHIVVGKPSATAKAQATNKESAPPKDTIVPLTPSGNDVAQNHSKNSVLQPSEKDSSTIRHSDKNLAANDIKKSMGSTSSQPSTTRCSKCTKDIPTSNFPLHELRCIAVEEKDKSTAGPPSRPGSSKSKKKKKKQEKAPAPAEEDFDALIAAAVADDTRCHVDKCKENAKILGQNCQFCTKRFCIKHHMAEVHGCGAAAKSHARMMISREGVLYRGSGVPDKTTDPVKRAHLERRLAKKLDKLTEGRKHKTNEK